FDGIPVRVDPESIPIFHIFPAGMRVGLRGRLQPIRRDDLPAFPAPLVKPQVSDLGHVARPQVEIAPAGADSLRIGRPDDILNPQWREELAPRKLQLTIARGLRNDSG